MSIINTISIIQSNLIILTQQLQKEKEFIIRATGTKKEKRILKLLHYTTLVNKIFEQINAKNIQ